MLCLKKEKPGEGLILTNAPKPRVGRGEVLIRVAKAGICGTDVHIYNWDRWSQRRLKPPLITGHEFVGRVEKLGEGVEGLKVGDRVAAEGHICCGTCEFCRTGQAHICQNVKIIGVDRDGCFASHLVMPMQNIWPVDPRIPDERAATFDPLGNAMHTVMTENLSGKTVLIVGAGAIGLFAIPIARYMGAARVIVAEPNPYRIAIAEKLKADLIIDTKKQKISETVFAEVDKNGVDVLLEMSGHPDGFREGLRSVKGAGAAVLLGIPSDPLTIDWAEDVIFKSLRIYGVNGRRMFDTWYQSQKFLALHGAEIDPVLTHLLPFEKFKDGFELLRAGNAGKVILDLEKI